YYRASSPTIRIRERAARPFHAACGLLRRPHNQPEPHRNPWGACCKIQGMPRVDRRTVDLSAYPDLIVIYLGMRVNALTGLKTVAGLGPQIDKSVADRPDGL